MIGIQPYESLESKNWTRKTGMSPFLPAARLRWAASAADLVVLSVSGLRTWAGKYGKPSTTGMRSAESLGPKPSYINSCVLLAHTAMISKQSPSLTMRENGTTYLESMAGIPRGHSLFCRRHVLALRQAQTLARQEAPPAQSHQGRQRLLQVVPA